MSRDVDKLLVALAGGGEQILDPPTEVYLARSPGQSMLAYADLQEGDRVLVQLPDERLEMVYHMSQIEEFDGSITPDPIALSDDRKTLAILSWDDRWTDGHRWVCTAFLVDEQGFQGLP